MIQNILFITDIHFGIPQTDRLCQELYKNFIPFLEQNDIDVLFFGGDYFHTKLSLYENNSFKAFKFFVDMMAIAKKKNIKVRFIEGTSSHERFQPRMLENMVNDVDYKIYENVGDETINGMKVLYIPEEYPMNINEYYSEYKNNQYDLIISHATWDFINFAKSIDNNRNDMHTAPVFKYNEWKHSLDHGVCLSGHIHGRHVFKNKYGTKIIYPGSFTSWNFDQISERGFLYGSIDTEKHTFQYKFINNPDAPKYANLDICDLGLDLHNVDIDVIKACIEKEKEKVDFIKVNIDKLPVEKKLIVKELFKNNSEITTDITTTDVLTENTNKSYIKYEYLLKDNLSIEEAIKRFIKEEFGEDLDVKVIKDVIKLDSST